MNIKIKKLEAVLTMWRWEHYFDSGQGNPVRGLFMWDWENALHLCTRFVSCLMHLVGQFSRVRHKPCLEKEGGPVFGERLACTYKHFRVPI